MVSSDNSMKIYVTNIWLKIKDLKRMGVKIDDWILVLLLLNNLNFKYKKFTYRTIISLNDILDFDKMITLLYKEEYLFKRDNKE